MILTHLDCDHVSGLIPLKNARHVYCSEEEWKHAQTRDVRYKSSFWEGVKIETLHMTENEKALFGKSCDVFGDGSVTAVLTPGHAEGSMAVFVRGNSGYAAFVGDDSYNRHSWEDLKLPGPVLNEKDMQKTLRWVRNLSSDPKCIGIYATHDPQGPYGGTDL